MNAALSSRKRWFFRLVLAGLAATFGLAVLEVTARLLGYAPPTSQAPVIPLENLHSVPAIREAQLHGWLHPPLQETAIDTQGEHPDGTIIAHRNRASFREDDDTPLAKPSGTIRIVVLGDSHTDGICWNRESYANQLESLLNSDAERSAEVDVINAGHSTFSPYQEWWIYERVVRHFSPDILIVAFYCGNDFWDVCATEGRVHLVRTDDGFEHSAEIEQPAVSHSPVDGSGDDGSSNPVKRFLRRKLALYHALAAIKPLRATLGNPPVKTDYELRVDALPESQHAAYWQDYGQAAWFAEFPDEWDNAVRRMEHVIDLFKDSADRDHVPVLFLLIPALNEIDRSFAAEAFDGAATTLKLTEVERECDRRVRLKMSDLLLKANVPCLDLSAAFRNFVKEYPDQPLYYLFDHHINVAAQTLIAVQLQSFLQTNGYLQVTEDQTPAVRPQRDPENGPPGECSL